MTKEEKIKNFREYVEKELTYFGPSSEEQIEAHKEVSDLFVEFGGKLAEIVPGSPDGIRMVHLLTLARALAQKSVAQYFDSVADFLDPDE